MFENLQAQNSIFNVSLDDAHALLAKLADKHPRLYANQTGSGDAYMIPEKGDQNNSDAPWVVQDGSSLDSMAVPGDLPIYLQVRFDGDPDYHAVGLIKLGAGL